MGEREESDDLAEATGKAAAAICIQAAVVETLVPKRLLTSGDAATLSAFAEQGLASLSQLSPKARLIAEGVIRGFAKGARRE